MDKKFYVYIVEKADGRYGLDIETGRGDETRDGILSEHVDTLAAVMHAIAREMIRWYAPEEWEQTSQD